MMLMIDVVIDVRRRARTFALVRLLVTAQMIIPSAVTNITIGSSPARRLIIIIIIITITTIIINEVFLVHANYSLL